MGRVERIVKGIQTFSNRIALDYFRLGEIGHQVKGYLDRKGARTVGDVCRETNIKELRLLNDISVAQMNVICHQATRITK
jgi:hypothetical protein